MRNWKKKPEKQLQESLILDYNNKNNKMKINIDKIAKLANLKLSDNEKITLEKQLEEILKYVEKLNTLNTTDVTETSQVTNLINITRKDTTDKSLKKNEALSQSKNTIDDFFHVDVVLE